MNNLYFLGTGRPIRPSTNPKLDREPSRNGVIFSGVTTSKEFQQNISQRLDIPATEIGRKASTIPRAIQQGIDVFA